MLILNSGLPYTLTNHTIVKIEVAPATNKFPIDHSLSKGPYGWQFAPFDKKFFTDIYWPRPYAHFDKTSRKNRALRRICPYDK